jgi:hypothetical protein
VDSLRGFVEHFTYLGIFAVLLFASLGVLIPEEMPIIARVAIQCGRANPYPAPYQVPHPVPYR